MIDLKLVVKYRLNQNLNFIIKKIYSQSRTWFCKLWYNQTWR